MWILYTEKWSLNHSLFISSVLVQLPSLPETALTLSGRGEDFPKYLLLPRTTPGDHHVSRAAHGGVQQSSASFVAGTSLQVALAHDSFGPQNSKKPKFLRELWKVKKKRGMPVSGRGAELRCHGTARPERAPRPLLPR